MFDIQTRKTNTKKVINFCQKNLFQITHNDAISGFLVFLFHWFSVSIIWLLLIFSEIGPVYFLGAVIWIIIMLGHLYFNGCIFTRIERELWQTKQWFGPWMFIFVPLQDAGVEITGNLANNIFSTWGVLIIMLILMKYCFS